jgi:hypothetical protein
MNKIFLLTAYYANANDCTIFLIEAGTAGMTCSSITIIKANDNDH